MTELRWDIFSKDALPMALFGESRTHVYGTPGFSSSNLADGQAALGFANRNQDGPYAPPSVVVISEKTGPDVLSWLHVYAPETSPLSQFARVITNKDWEEFGPKHQIGNTDTRADAWACVVLGELLAHGESDTDIKSIPLSRSSACFTTAIARTAIIHGDQEATRTAVQRLILLESDRRFARRSVTIEDLVPAWAIIGARLNSDIPVSEVADLVLNATSQHARDSGKQAPFRSLTQAFPGLTSDSMEERVLAFQKVATETSKFIQADPHNLLTNVTVAAAAFLVGRGTTHAFLLRRWNRVYPLAFLWFGVMAALAGPRQWDTSWSRAVKSIEKVLRTTFNWEDPPSADLCWTEYSWMARTFDGPEIFSELPKMFAKVLSVELVPGATCQLKLESAQGKSADIDHSAQPIPTQREKELETALARLIEAAAKAQPLLDPKFTSLYGGQRSLPLDGKDSEEKAAKRKRGKRQPHTGTT